MCAGRISWIVGLVLAVLLAIPAAAQENAEKLAARAKEEAKAKPKPLFVMAVMNFRAKGKAMASLCEDVPNLLAAFLSQDESLELVERAELLGSQAERQTVPYGNSQALVNKVVTLLGNRQEAARLGAENRRRAEERFDLTRMVGAYEAVWEALAEG